MKREDIIQEFKQNDGSFKSVVIELVNGRNVYVYKNDTIDFRRDVFIIYNEDCIIHIYYDNIKGLEVINGY